MLQDVLHRPGPARDAVARIEAEGVAEGALTEPHPSEGVQETLVQVVCHPAAVLHLACTGTEAGGCFYKKNETNREIVCLSPWFMCWQFV